MEICYNEFMNELREIVANNLVELRKKNRLTQSELAIKLNYSDKSISKWENSNSLPGIEILYELCNLYNVSLDYLTSAHNGEELPKENSQKRGKNKQIISLLSVSLVWILSTFLFVILNIVTGNFFWLIYIWALPISSIVLLVFNSIWGLRKYTFFIITLLVWTLILALYLTILLCLEKNLWLIFVIGVPAEIAILLWARLEKPHQ